MCDRYESVICVVVSFAFYGFCFGSVKNTGSTMASNLTLVTEILNSAGTVVGSQSQTGRNIAPQQTLNLSYAWTAASPAGTYTIEGLVQDASGKTLEHAQVGTVTVQ